MYVIVRVIVIIIVIVIVVVIVILIVRVKEALNIKKIDLIWALPKRGGVGTKPNGLGLFIKLIVGSQNCRKGFFGPHFPGSE